MLALAPGDDGKAFRTNLHSSIRLKGCPIRHYESSSAALAEARRRVGTSASPNSSKSSSSTGENNRTSKGKKGGRIGGVLSRAKKGSSIFPVKLTSKQEAAVDDVEDSLVGTSNL